MAAPLALLAHQVGMVWKHFGINQKVSVVLALGLTLAATGGLLWWSGRPDYRLLYTGLSLEEAARAREQLEDERIPVQIRAHGQALYVPAADVYRARLLLAASGMPKDASTGFELFEQPRFGLTEFAQQVNFQRALQGELERTISAIEGVASARIMLVMPRDRLFASERDKSASASIMLSLARGVRLSPEQVNSIRQLVGTAVPGLVAGHVTITDQQGRILADATGAEDPMVGISQRQQDLRRAIENELTRKAQDMLDLSLGGGQAIVRVSADVDFRRVERHRETYDADGRVLVRENISTESSSEPVRAMHGGTARVAVGDPSGVTSDASMAMGTRRREDVDSEYRVPSGRETILDQGGRITRLSVSVSVAQGPEPRDAEALQRIERMVRSAVGATDTPERQDAVDIIEMAFSPVETVQVDWPWWERLPFAPSAALRSVGGLLLLMMLYILSRRTVMRLSVEREAVGVPISAMLAGADGGKGEIGSLSHHESPGDETEFDTVGRLAEQNPSMVANWIEQTVRGRA